MPHRVRSIQPQAASRGQKKCMMHLRLVVSLQILMSVPHLFCMGNPLLDISSEVPLSFVEKHGLKMNNAILAGAEFAPFFDELVKTFPVEYVAGGATQNSARVFKWMSQSRATVSYCGCIGKDEFGRQLDKQARQDGVDVQYLISETEPTGSCGVLVNNSERSLVARLGAAEKYAVSHLESPAIQQLVNQASHFYISGFFMTHSHDSILKVAQHAADNNKVMCMNTSATFLWEVPFLFGLFNQLMPFIDILFGNESEALSASKAYAFGTDVISEIASNIAKLPKTNSKRGRIVVITQGSDPTIIAAADVAGNVTVTQEPVQSIPKSCIVDTNGAGDSFVGGFLSSLILGSDLSRCAAAGAYCGGMMVQRSGCSLPARVGTFCQSF